MLKKAKIQTQEYIEGNDKARGLQARGIYEKLHVSCPCVLG
jgi:hypothetical protein